MSLDILGLGFVLSTRPGLGPVARRRVLPREHIRILDPRRWARCWAGVPGEKWRLDLAFALRGRALPSEIRA